MSGYPDGLTDDELAFQQRYGPWRPLGLDELCSLFAGWSGQWWVCGGWAIEAFTGRPREHGDVDVGWWFDDLPGLRTHLEPRYHLWSAGGGMLRPVDDHTPELHPESSQVWLREHALAPWVADLVGTPRVDGAYALRFDPEVTLPVDEALVAYDGWPGVRFLAAHVVLAYKARARREKDERDLDAALPRLDEDARRWLRHVCARLDAHHPWLPRL